MSRTMDDTYHRLRVARHAHYLKLDEEAWRLVDTLLQRIQHETACIGRAAHQRWKYLFRIYERAERRWRRRAEEVNRLGLSTKLMQELNTGDVVLWRGRELRIVDWTCHRDPVHGLDGRRIWAEPHFADALSGAPVTLSSCYWREVVWG
jgi:hypothetical protein